jgi:methylthioribose-1-phosphate isomerase
VLTICNTGSLATAGHGTALGVIRTAYEQGKLETVFACETRPRQQGLRLTAWELAMEDIPFFAIADGVVGWLMHKRQVDVVIAGADRIAANGDTANKIGTYSLAVLAQAHSIPFYIAAPISSFDSSLASGEMIPIEERSADELTVIEGIRIAPANCPVYNPAFDITPGHLIEAFITERGVFRKPFQF